MNFSQDILIVLLIAIFAQSTGTELANNTNFLLLLLLALAGFNNNRCNTNSCCCGNYNNYFQRSFF